MMKKFISLILAVVLILPAIPAFAGTAWDGADKTEPVLEDGAYRISSASELAWFADATKTDGAINAVLTDNIDLNGKDWSPIGLPDSGYVTEAFSGTFDGNGYSITGLRINTDKAFYGLFWVIYGGTVKNLNVSGNVATTGNTAGGIAGKLQGGTVESCSFSGAVTASKNYAGGIVGNIVTNSKVVSSITGCCNKGEISGKYAGGILGYTTAKANISHCYNTGTINGSTRSAGISGQQTAGSISYCYNTGKSSSGISGFSNAAITNCYYLDEAVAPGGSASGYEKITDKDTLLDNLNAGESKLFVKDTKNKNDGYPVLEWQNRLTPEEEAAEQKKKEDAEKVKKAVEELSIDTSAIKSECTIKLPSELDDCSIDWTSSNADIISNNGKVSLPEKNIATVTLTAKITCGESSADKEFLIPVWSKSIDADVYLDAALDAMEWNFNELQPVYGEDGNILVKFQNLLKSKGFDGLTVTVNSTADESLVAKTGKILYPEIDENSFADGRQVKVIFNLSLDGKSVVFPATDNYSLLIPWDTSRVKETLESTADTELSESVIADANLTLDAVSSDLNLPSNINRYSGKYSYAEVVWESSDNTHISISYEKRQGSADNMIYGPYVGKTYRDDSEHTVILTATIKNPSTNVTIKKEFIVTVSPLSTEELNQTLDKMNAILDCYTADKLKAHSTQKQLDINAVDNDIQLVIPKDVVTADELTGLNYGKYWDYWNYKFSVTSSDTNVIEINSFRAFVYRPLGEDSSADRKITLTVKMASKENPNLFVTKNIDVTVKHLSREDINAQLDLMDRAKENYASGLLGSNADSFSIIDNLSPYQEIVWNKDKSGVEFVRNHSDIQGTGIIVDTLPGWEEQEDWRLFRTSDKDLISNETLVLNKAPNKNTFIKINSVLTDETLGKYYNKFKDAKGFDTEALAKFKQLYKQPVSAYVMAVGADSYTEEFASMSTELKEQTYSTRLLSFKKEIDKPISVTFTLLGLDGAPIISKTAENSFTKGATVFDVFKKIISDNNMYYAAKGSYVSSINDLTERAYGGSSGWMYSVDGVFVNSYMNAQELSGGEDIIVMYVRDYADANRQHDSNQDSDEGNNNSNPEGSSNQNNNSKPNRTDSGNQNNNSATYSQSSADNKGKNNVASVSNGKTNNSFGTQQIENETSVQTAEEDGNNPINDGKDKKDISDAENGNSKSSNDTANRKIIIPAIIVILLLILISALFALKKRKKELN